MEALFGESLINKDGKVNTVDICGEGKFTGVYFGAHWAPPCRDFTEKLITVYTELNKSNRNLEVVFCSADGDEAHFKENLSGMPWAAIDFNEVAVREKLKQKFGIDKIPTLVILNDKGNIVSKEGAKDIKEKRGEALIEFWVKSVA